MADATDTNSLKDVKETNTSPNASPLTATAGRDAAIVPASHAQGAAAKATAPWGEWDVRERPAPYLVTATLVPLTM